MRVPYHDLMISCSPSLMLETTGTKESTNVPSCLSQVRCLREEVRTSRLLTSLTPDWKPTTLSRRPSTMALRCRATP